jgi:hypothetical protein
MSNRDLMINIRCGDLTCYEAPEKPCPWLRTCKYGQVYFCQLFGHPNQPLEDKDGWLQRDGECLGKEVK